MLPARRGVTHRVGVLLTLCSLVWAAAARAEEAVTPLLRQYVPGLAEGMKDLPAFVRDTEINVHFRTFYFNRQNSDFTANKAWAGGGWLEYKSGWLGDVFRVGAVGYTSQPLYAPDDRDGTLLLGPDQDSLLVLGQAYAQLRYQHYALLTGYRQLVNEGYVNPQDNRMIPNTFEGATLAGVVGAIGYDVGYLTAMKTRNSEDFVNMAKVAGVPDHNRGLLLTSLTFNPDEGPDALAPLKGLTVYAGNYLTFDTLNTAYLNPEYTRALTDKWSAQLGIQYTDQRSVGSGFLGDFSTWNVGARVQVNWRELSLFAAMSATGPDAALRTPYGIWPGYLSLIELDFDRANEKAWGVGATYNWAGTTFKDVKLPNLSVLLFYAQGRDALTPTTGARLPTRHEGDLDIIWKPPWVKGLQLRFRNIYVGQEAPRLLQEFRIILDYELPVL
jgi:hypothetical protein